MKIYTIILALLSGWCSAAMAQGFSNLTNKAGKNVFQQDWFELYARYTSLATQYNGNYGALTVNVGISSDDYHVWNTRFHFENPSLGDLLHGIPTIAKDINNIKSGQSTNITTRGWDNHSHGSGLLGWWQYYINVVGTDNLLVSPGLSFGDYIYGSQYATSTSNPARHEPEGYYLYYGPALMVTFVPAKALWIDVYTRYDFTFIRVENKDQVDPNYPWPRFFTVGTNLYSTHKFFGGIRLNRLIDKGYSNDASSRLDISAGIRF